VREALFSMLGDVSDLRAADLFAGSGALGIEALSRGAAAVFFLEKAPRVAQTLRENLDALGAKERARVQVGNALSMVQAGKGLDGTPWDLIFLDPPYALDLPEAFLSALSGLLTQEGRLIFEQDKRSSAPAIAGMRLRTERNYGDTVVRIFES
jgi:16S rRNA (guanine966-N2)-methyltransferase